MFIAVLNIFASDTMSSPLPNPYEPPREPDPISFREDSPSSIARLEQRIAQLEAQLEKSWFLRPNILFRIFAVLGHFLLGYGLIAIVGFSLFTLIDYLTSPRFFR
jgi:hypothetical protein